MAIKPSAYVDYEVYQTAPGARPPAPGTWLKTQYNVDTGQSELVPYDGIGQPCGYLSSTGETVSMQGMPPLLTESIRIPRRMVTCPEMFRRDCILGGLYRRDLLELLGDQMVYERVTSPTGAFWSFTL